MDWSCAVTHLLTFPRGASRCNRLARGLTWCLCDFWCGSFFMDSIIIGRIGVGINSNSSEMKYWIICSILYNPINGHVFSWLTIWLPVDWRVELFDVFFLCYGMNRVPTANSTIGLRGKKCLFFPHSSVTIHRQMIAANKSIFWNNTFQIRVELKRKHFYLMKWWRKLPHTSLWAHSIDKE